MRVGEKVLFYSARFLPWSASTVYLGTIVDKFWHPKYPDDDGMCQFKIRLDKRMFGLIPVYEWRRLEDIRGIQDTSMTELERMAKL